MPNFQGSGFTIELPDDCMDASSYAFVLPENNGFSANLTIRFEPATYVSDLQAHVNLSLDALKASVVDFVLINQVAGKRGPHTELCLPMSGLAPIALMWSVISITSPGSKSGLSPPAALVTISAPTPSACITRTGKMTSDIGYPS